MQSNERCVMTDRMSIHTMHSTGGLKSHRVDGSRSLLLSLGNHAPSRATSMTVENITETLRRSKQTPIRDGA